MPERLEIYIVYKRRYIHMLPFLFSSVDFLTVFAWKHTQLYLLCLLCPLDELKGFRESCRAEHIRESS